MTMMKYNTHSESQQITIPQKQLGRVQIEILEVVWDAEEATVKHIARAIAEKRLGAFNTIPTALKRLRDRGLLSRTTDGKRFHYRATVSREQFLPEAL